jgi:thymidylate synthase
MNNIEHDYLKLLHDILNNGIEKQDRTGTGTISVFGRQIRHDMSLGFPLLTTKKMPFKTIVTELLWFLRGDTNIKFLVDNNCHIWDGDAYKNYVKHWEPNIEYIDNKPILTQEEFINKIKTDDEFAKKWGELGPIYGRQWRNWNAIFDGGVDQIQNLIRDLKTNPDSRRLMVNAWNVGELNQMILPPCHYGFQVYTRELRYGEKLAYVIKHIDPNITDTELAQLESSIPKRAISLMWNQRSVDTPLGLPFNIASYALLLEMLARETNMVADELIGNLGDCHIYSNQVDGVREQLTRQPMALSKLVINDEFWNPDANLFDQIAHIQPSDFYIEHYESHPKIVFPLSN